MNIEEQSVTPNLSQDAENGGAVSIQKFKSREELEKAYLNLEKAFTKKCQALSDLEKTAGTSVPPPAALDNQNPKAENNPATDFGGSGSVENLNGETFDLLLDCVLTNDRLKGEVLKSYLMSLKRGSLPLNIENARPALTSLKPKTLEEAGKLALYLLKK